MNKSAVYFDMDGVLCDWVSEFNKRCDMPLEEFNKLSKSERWEMKETLFGYDFFRNMKPIEKGMNYLKNVIDYGKDDVYILSAVGDSSHVEEIKQAKYEWVREFIGDDIEIMFVDKVVNKYKRKKPNYVFNTLVDDREKAIDAWKANGGYGVLFKE